MTTEEFAFDQAERYQLRIGRYLDTDFALIFDINKNEAESLLSEINRKALKYKIIFEEKTKTFRFCMTLEELPRPDSGLENIYRTGLS